MRERRERRGRRERRCYDVWLANVITSPTHTHMSVKTLSVQESVGRFRRNSDYLMTTGHTHYSIPPCPLTGLYGGRGRPLPLLLPHDAVDGAEAWPGIQDGLHGGNEVITLGAQAIILHAVKTGHASVEGL